MSPFAPNFELFIAGRLLAGVLLAGLPAIAVTALAETVTPLTLGAAVGGFVGGNSIGGLLGRIVAAVVGEMTTWRWGLFTVALMSAVIAVVFVVVVPPTAVKPAASLPVWRATRENLRNSGVLSMVLFAFLMMGGFVAAFNYLTFRLQQPPFGLTPSQTALFFLAYLGAAVASRMVWVVVRRFSEVPVLLGGIGVMLVGLACMLTPWLAVIACGLVMFTTAFFGSHSIALTLSGQWAGTGGRALAPTLYNFAYYAGSTLLGWAGGIAFAAGGWPGTAAMIAGCALATAALVLGAVAVRQRQGRRITPRDSAPNDDV